MFRLAPLSFLRDAKSHGQADLERGRCLNGQKRNGWTFFACASQPRKPLRCRITLRPAQRPALPFVTRSGAPQPRIVSVGPGGFLRQGPGDQQAPIPPAPPRRLVPAKPSAEIAGKTSLLDLTERICKWPMGHPGEPDFHFCGEAVNPGFPYCVEHCGRAYQAQLPRGTRRPPPPPPFGGPRVR